MRIFNRRERGGLGSEVDKSDKLDENNETEKIIEEKEQESGIIFNMKIPLVGGGSPLEVGRQEMSEEQRKRIALDVSNIAEEYARDKHIKKYESKEYDLERKGMYFSCQGEFETEEDAVDFARKLGHRIGVKSDDVYFDTKGKLDELKVEEVEEVEENISA